MKKFLEARSSFPKAFLAEKPGISTKVLASTQNAKSQIKILSYLKEYRKIREIPYSLKNVESDSIETETYNFINLSQKFDKGSRDPQQVLDIYFEYFKYRKPTSIKQSYGVNIN